ncbi:MAG: hypothetical protein PHT94_01940 [Candidatus Nanoarchaeia archaeon]|nr:hypothetical protein [Candidatus Nanoarchaeia archaeon]
MMDYLLEILLVLLLVVIYYFKSNYFKIGKFKNIIGFSSGLIIGIIFIYFLNLMIKNYSVLEHFNLTLLLWGFVLIFVLKQYVLTEINKYWEIDLMLNKIKFIEYGLSSIFLVFIIFITTYLSKQLNFRISFAFMAFLVFYTILLEINFSKILEKAYFKPQYKYVIALTMIFSLISCILVKMFIPNFLDYMFPFIIGFFINSMFDTIIDKNKTYNIIWFVSGIVVANLLLILEFIF